ncbi:FAD-binding protein [Streptomyces sp. NPDC039022]|uniref:FAD-binding oxidoreductase n=1 Tax=unclassified Streptomyces TaxID=2593676 RepID=UPI0034005CE3
MVNGADNVGLPELLEGCAVHLGPRPRRRYGLPPGAFPGGAPQAELTCFTGLFALAAGAWPHAEHLRADSDFHWSDFKPGLHYQTRPSFPDLPPDNGALTSRIYCASEDDVRQAVGFARRHGLEVHVRGGGHSLAGFSTGTGMVIDVSGIHHVLVEDGLVRVGAGTQTVDLHDALRGSGLPLPSAVGAPTRRPMAARAAEADRPATGSAPTIGALRYGGGRRVRAVH